MGKYDIYIKFSCRIPEKECPNEGKILSPGERENMFLPK